MSESGSIISKDSAARLSGFVHISYFLSHISLGAPSPLYFLNITIIKMNSAVVMIADARQYAQYE